jgi:tetratricopeptide (TPR) repeat protein
MKKCLPLDHFDFSLIYNNIGLIYSANAEYTEALDNYNKALSIETIQDHPFAARTYLNIGDVHRMTENNDLALESYEKSLNIQLNCSTQNNADLLRTYNVMTVVYNEMNDKERSLEYYKKFLQYLLIERPLDFDEHLTAYKNIADLLFMTNDFKAATEHYEKAMEAAQNISSPCPKNIKMIQDMIDLLKRNAPTSLTVGQTDDKNH